MRHKQQAQAVFADALEKKIALTPALKTAFTAVPRDLFVPPGLERMAYELEALPMGANQWLSSPLTVARMTLALQPETGDSVLEIGCGSGYQAAILGKLFRRVFTVERIERLLNEAKGRFKTLGLINVHTRLADGHEGWAQYGPYDRILLSCETPQIPQTLFDQLEPNGLLVAPVGGKIVRHTKYPSGRIVKETLENCQFVPMLGGVEKA